MSDHMDNVRKVLAAPEDVELPKDMEASGATDGFADDEGWDNMAPDPAPRDDDPEGPPPPEARCAGYPLNDYGNGKRLVEHFGDDLLYVPRVGYHVWVGTHWARDEDEFLVRQKAHQLGALIAKETRHLELTEAQEQALLEGDAAAPDVETLGAIRAQERTEEQARRYRDATAAMDRADKVRADQKTAIGRRLTHAKNAGNSNSIKNLMTEASVMMKRDLEELDADPLIINTLGGVLHFRREADPAEVEAMRGTGASPDPVSFVLQPHDRQQLITKIMPVDYDPAAKCPLFDKFLNRIMPKQAMRSFLQRWYGYSMTALTSEQKFVFQWGGGANGKSVLSDLIARIAGDYAATAKIESLTGSNRRGGSDATPDLVPLIGARMVRASEPDEGQQLQEGLIKELTGGEPILVRALHTNFIKVYPHFKLTISGNHQPEIRGGDDGIWRRVLMVPFEIQIPPDERDKKLGEKLWEERAGILNWLIDGLLDYLANGLQEPPEVLAATQEYREDSDPIGAFLESACRVTGDAADILSSRELGQAFNFWLTERGMSQWKPTTVSKRIKSHSRQWKSPSSGKQFTEIKSSTMAYSGIFFHHDFHDRFVAWKHASERDQS
ncbi:phage/plasmid primase, P4 family [Cereibacter sp. SYSU M97828]|nr:phage/plasmid primase, P4 family [Cereibacter flavus]